MKKYFYNGYYYNARQLSEMCGIKYTTLLGRLERGYSVEEAVSWNTKIPDSIREFDKASDYHDWSGMINSELYEHYKSWCIKNEFRVESNVHFTRSIKQLHPNIRIVPTRIRTGNDISYKRVVRVDYYK